MSHFSKKPSLDQRSSPPSSPALGRVASVYETQRSTGLRFSDTFLQLFCEKNSDGTKKLRLKGNELHQRFKDRMFPADMVNVCDFLKDHSEINELDVSYNEIGDEGMETLCDMTLRHASSLEHLLLIHCDIGEKGMKAFYHTVQESRVELKTLRLTGNKIGRNGGHLMALAIPLIPTLEYLDLGDTDQAVDSIDCVFQQLEIYPTCLKFLDVSRAVPPTSLLRVDHTSLGENLKALFTWNKTLVEIHVQKCELDAHCVEAMITGLKGNAVLRFLDLGYNNICCVGAEFLSDWLKTGPDLLGLNIAGNKIKDHGGVALSFGMPFSRIRYLDISHNLIGNEGIIAILYTIKKPYMLRYFLLWGNKFSHPANKIIQRMMLSKVLEQERVDVKVYCVDDVLYAARYPADKYKNRYYNSTEFACATDVKIKRNRLEHPDDQPRALVNFKHIDRYPPVEIPKKTN